MTAPPENARTTLEAERVSGRDVFISYAREDQPFVRRLHDALADRGRNPWVDWEGIPPSAEWLREVKRAIEATESFIFVLSPDSSASRVCREEAEHAAATGKRVIPLLRREVDDAAVPEAVAAHNWISFRDEDDFDASTDALSRALDTDLDWVRAHTRLLVRAAEWDEEGRDRSFLLRGKDLESAERWLADAGRHPEPKPTPLHTEYILASRRAAVRAQRGRLAGLSAAVLVSLVLAAVALVQQRRAEEQTQVARSRELAATSLEQLERDPQLSLLLAIEAYERAPTAQAEAAVRRALVNSHLRRVLPVESTDVTPFDVGPDGKLIATASPDGSTSLWDRPSGERLAVLEDPDGGAAPAEGEPPDPGPPVHPSFSPDGSRLLVKQPDGSAVIWSVPDRRLVTRLEELFWFAGWTPGGGSLLVVGTDHVARLHDSSTGEVRAEFVGSAPPSHEGFGPPATLSPDGRNLAMSDGANVRVVRVGTGRTLAVFAGAPREFSLDGRYLIADVDEDSVQVFDVQSLRRVRVLDVGPLAYDAALSPDGRRLLTGHEDGARVWDVRSGQRLVELLGHGGAVYTVSFSPDGRSAITAGEDSTARLWDVETGRTLAVLAGHAGPVDRAVFTPDGQAVVSSGISSGDGVRIWEVGGGQTALLRGHEAPVTTARFSPDGRTILSAGVDGTARAWDVATERQTSLLRAPRFPGALEVILFAEFGMDDRLGVISGYQGGPELLPDQEPARLWDVRSGHVRLELAPPGGGSCRGGGACPFIDAALSPDGTRLATVGEDGALRLWDAANETGLATAQLRHTSAVEWTPDGASIVALAEHAGEQRPNAGPAPSSIVVVDAVTLRKTRQFGQGEGVFHRGGLELSADGSLVAAGFGNRAAQVFEVATGRLVAELPHAGPVFDVGFSPDGRFLVTASSDAPTIWDLRSQRPLVELFGHRAGVLTVEFSPDGSSILSAGVDQTIRIWRCEVCAPIDQLLNLAHERALRDLTTAERARYLHEG